MLDLVYTYQVKFDKEELGVRIPTTIMSIYDEPHHERIRQFDKSMNQFPWDTYRLRYMGLIIVYLKIEIIKKHCK